MVKLYAALVILCVVGSYWVEGFDKQEVVAIFMANVDNCKTEVGARDADIEELLGKKPASSMEGKCLRACLMKKYEVMDNNGKFVKSIAKSLAGKYSEGDEDKLKIAHKIIDDCAGIDIAADHCEAAELYGKCFVEQAMAHGLQDKLGF